MPNAIETEQILITIIRARKLPLLSMQMEALQ